MFSITNSMKTYLKANRKANAHVRRLMLSEQVAHRDFDTTTIEACYLLSMPCVHRTIKHEYGL